MFFSTGRIRCASLRSAEITATCGIRLLFGEELFGDAGRGQICLVAGRTQPSPLQSLLIKGLQMSAYDDKLKREVAESKSCRQNKVIAWCLFV
jgi:hypothetical protein